jgi:hypothetical protein
MTRPVGWFSGFPNVAAHFKPVQKRPSFEKLFSYGKEATGLPSRPKQL